MTSENKLDHAQPADAGRWSRARRPAALLAGLAVGVALLGAASAPAIATTIPSGTPGVTGHAAASTGGTGTAARQAVAYWTRSRMLSARNADTITAVAKAGVHAALARPSGPAGRVAGAAADQALAGQAGPVALPLRRQVTPQSGSAGSAWTGYYYQPPATTTGKVFFTTHDGEEWVCSASTVNSNGKDAVITAAHCVYGSLGGEVPGETWHANWIFVPDYYDGYAPYGQWTARQLWTLTNYIYNQDEGDDIGAAVINTNAYGQHIVNVVGGQGLAWNWPADQYVYDFGYPAAPPFTGQSLQYCSGYEFTWSYVSSTMGLYCNFTGGSSGGPWLMGFNGEWGYINGINDFGYLSLPGYIFSAYFGNNADSLYNAVASL